MTEKISDGSTGNVAIDFYHKYKVKPNMNNLLSLVYSIVFIIMVTKSLASLEDIKMLKFISMDAMRFSISYFIKFLEKVWNYMISSSICKKFGCP